ncbi:hypothetical protein CRUP_030397 [Coryphaenoides rupestris]|nr:hypothetical protein CRUP_030397 [Coryphaenoides rupestris]
MAESEAETPSTPIEFESKYFEFDGVRLPPFCRGKMGDISSFSLRGSDIWIVTYPKSGTSLLQEVVYLVSQGADPDEIGLMNIDEQLPVLEYPQPGLDIIQVIYMARNPKDLVVSYYQFHRSLRTMSYRGTFQEFCRRFMNDKLGYGSWFDHVQEFWEHRMDANVLFLKYEDMYKVSRTTGTSLLQEVVYLVSQGADPDEIGLYEHRRAAARPGVPPAGPDIIQELTSPRLIKSHLPLPFPAAAMHSGEAKVTSSYSRLGYGSWFDHVQEFWEHRMDANVLFLKYEDMYKVHMERVRTQTHTQQVPTGRVGLWKDVFTVSMNDKFDGVYRQKMGKSDLTFDFGL